MGSCELCLGREHVDICDILLALAFLMDLDRLIPPYRVCVFVHVCTCSGIPVGLE
jgi:hypothetical protein